MKNKRHVHRFKGYCMGQELAVLVCKRLDTFSKIPDTILQWGNTQMTIGDYLDMSLYRKVPSGYLTPRVKASDWEPFVMHAIALGYL